MKRRNLLAAAVSACAMPRALLAEAPIRGCVIGPAVRYAFRQDIEYPHFAVARVTGIVRVWKNGELVWKAP